MFSQGLSFIDYLNSCLHSTFSLLYWFVFRAIFSLEGLKKSSRFCWCILDSSQNRTEGVEALHMKLIFIWEVCLGF